MAAVFVTGATGYIGSRLTSRLLAKGHTVRALVRAGSERKLPAGAEAVIGNPLDATSFAGAVRSGETFVQLVGTPHPSPAKAAQFRAVDRVSGLASIENAAKAGVAHFIYVSVAHPAPTMKAYIEVRAECEAALVATGLPATILRPWYVLGPGHRWPYAIMPLYKLAELIPQLRDGATRLGLVTLEQMLRALTAAVGSKPQGARIWTVPDIRAQW